MTAALQLLVFCRTAAALSTTLLPRSEPPASTVSAASSRAELSSLAFTSRKQSHRVAEESQLQLASIAARTRITVQPVEAGATSLHVKRWSGFDPGARVRINPGGTTEEDNELLLPSLFTLAAPLRYMHGLGETVLQLGGSAAVERPRSPAPRVEAGWPLRPSSHPQLQPSPRLMTREPPLVGSLSHLFRHASFYVHGRWGVEAAGALLIVMLAALGMVGYAANIFFEYSLCCFWRRKEDAPSEPGCLRRASYAREMNGRRR